MKKGLGRVSKPLSILLMAIALPAGAQDDRGLEVAKAMEAGENGFGNYSATMTMVLVSTSGKETVRELRVQTREVEGDGDQSLAVFDSPADVKGTGFLSHTHIGRDDEQWLYLPALKRVKRISPANKTSPFMGSEFSYEDLASFEVGNYTYEYIGEEAEAGIDCFVVDRFPVYDHSGYSRERMWVDKDRYVTLKIDFYDLRGELKKTLTSGDFQLHLDRYWYSHKMIMVNYQSGKGSELDWHDFKFREQLREADFNPNRLANLR